VPVEADGTFTKRQTPDILQDLLDALREQFGDKVDTTPAGTIRKLLEAAVALPLAETENTLDDLYRQMFFESATADNLDKLLEPFGFSREPATRATGTVNVTLGSSLASPPQPNPYFPAYSLVFLDTAGNQYENYEEISLPGAGTASLVIKVRALDLGADGNVAAGSIANVRISDSVISGRWASNVTAFTNDADLAGGQDKETDQDFRRRVRNSLASVEGASLDGLIVAIEAVDGVTGVTGKENNADLATAENTVFAFTTSGLASETIDATRTRIAQKVVTTERRFVQYWNAKLNTDTNLVCKVRLETDSAGTPSGTLVNPVFEQSGFDFNGTTLTQGQWDNGANLDPGTYWLVFERESGSGTFDGHTSGTADRVKTYASSWTLSTTVENLRIDLVGGVPPHGIRFYISGGTPNDIASAIWKHRPAGIPTDGAQSGTVTDRSGQAQTIYFDRPAQVPLYLNITVTKSGDFTSDANAIKDIIVAYIGGIDSKGNLHPGLKVAEKVIKNEIISRALDDELVVGTVDVTDLKLDRANPPVNTGNLAPGLSEEFTIAALGDITVTLQDA